VGDACPLFLFGTSSLQPEPAPAACARHFSLHYKSPVAYNHRSRRVVLHGTGGSLDGSHDL